ncbi:MAG: ABC transporter permease, partial [Actinomycetia bacterium]|nr:ABC transporter permease [Actinomycetes bacterium]
LDAASARSFLTVIASSFGGTMILIVLLIVASTLALSVQQRRREIALLRAVAATPRQVNRLIVAEATMLSFVAALLGTVPGIGLSMWLRQALLDLDIVPPGFEFTVGPLPVIASVLCCVIAGGAAGRVASRRANRISPIEALGAAVVEPPRLGRVRLVIGWVVVAVGVVTGIALPLTVGGPAALGSAAGSALLMVLGVAIVGPQLLSVATRAVARLGLRRTAPGWLASANTGARSRRLSTATTPLILGITLASVQLFSQATTGAATDSQVESGLVADRVLVADDGIAPEIAGAVRRVPDVTATAVTQTQVMVTYDEFGDPVTETYAAQGATPEGIDTTMDLDVSDGDLAELGAGTVALSEFAADTFGVSVGSQLSMRLGDGTHYDARVVATYARGLGFGDLTLPDEVVRASTTSGLNDYVLLAGGDADSLRTALAPYGEVTMTDRESFTAAQVEGRAGENTLGLLLNLALLAFIAIAVVNVLVLATTSRTREFALLRLIGAQPRQVRAMMRGEMVTIVAMAVVVGLLAAAPPLLGMSFALTGSALPTMPPLIVGSIVLVAVALGWSAISLPTRYALRTAPVAAMGVGE